MRRIGPDMWIAEAPLKLGGLDFGVRMSVLRCADSTLLLHSPIPLSDDLTKQVRALGEVRHLVAPNGFHHLFLEAAMERFPEAAVYAPPALRKKKPDLRIDRLLTPGDPSPWPGIELCLLEGAPRMDEAVLYHRASRTLVLCDLVFHMCEGNRLTRAVFKMMGVWGRPAQSPLWRYLLTKDREAAARSLAPMWGWDLDRVVLAHGRPIEGPQSKAQLADALRWMCGAQPELHTA